MERLKELETENTQLRRAVLDLTLDKLILAEAAKMANCGVRDVGAARTFTTVQTRASLSAVKSSIGRMECSMGKTK